MDRAKFTEYVHSVYAAIAKSVEDKDADGMLAALSALGETFVATASGNPRALPARELAARAETHFAEVKTAPEPADALRVGRETAGEGAALLVTGSLYLLADLAPFRPATALPWRQ